MKKSLLFVFLLLNVHICFGQDKFSTEIQNISNKIIAQITGPSALAKLEEAKAPYKVAIVAIQNEDKKNTKLTDLIADNIAVNLAIESNGRYDILDRTNIDKLIKEKNIPIAYDNKRDFARSLGRIKSANFMVVGVLSNFENDFYLNIQIIETKEGNLIGGAAGTITATKLLREKNGESLSEYPTSQNSNKEKQYNDKPQGQYGDFYFKAFDTNYPPGDVYITIYKVRSDEVETTLSGKASRDGAEISALDLPVGVHKVKINWDASPNPLKWNPGDDRTINREIRVEAGKKGRLEIRRQ